MDHYDAFSMAELLEIVKREGTAKGDYTVTLIEDDVTFKVVEGHGRVLLQGLREQQGLAMTLEYF